MASVETSSRLAHNLDERMLSSRLLREVAAGQGRRIAAPGTDDADLWPVQGVIAALELGNRFLIRYLTGSKLKSAPVGTTEPTFVSPTPFTPTEAAIWLALPGTELRNWYILLDARRLGLVSGPRYAQFGGGLEYLLPDGYPEDAVVAVGTRPATRWALRVT